MTAAKGTRGYMAPQVYMGSYNEAADVFSLSASMYEVANLKPAYSGAAPEDMMKLLILKAAPKPFDDMCPEKLRPIITKGLKLNPADRPTIGAICQDLKAIKSGEKFLVGQLKAELNGKNAE